MILIIGETGQVAQALKKQAPTRVKTLSRQHCDLSNPEKIASTLSPILETTPWKCVINAAAYTHVDKAETEKELCKNVNAKSPIQMALLCKALNIPFIHYSTDYVYGSNDSSELTESSPCQPVNYYGQTKLEADQEIQQINGRGFILRTSWVYDHQGKNFATTMLKLFKTQPKLKVVSDQVGSPTYAPDIADLTLRLVDKLRSVTGTEILHLTNSGHLSWYDFAHLLLKMEKNKNPATTLTQSIEPILTSDWPTPAKRQLNSRLSLEKLKQKYGLVPRTTAEALVDLFSI